MSPSIVAKVSKLFDNANPRLINLQFIKDRRSHHGDLSDVICYFESTPSI